MTYSLEWSKSPTLGMLLRTWGSRSLFTTRRLQGVRTLEKTVWWFLARLKMPLPCDPWRHTSWCLLRQVENMSTKKRIQSFADVSFVILETWKSFFRLCFVAHQPLWVVSNGQKMGRDSVFCATWTFPDELYGYVKGIEKDMIHDLVWLFPQQGCFIFRDHPQGAVRRF